MSVRGPRNWSATKLYPREEPCALGLSVFSRVLETGLIRQLGNYCAIYGRKIAKQSSLDVNGRMVAGSDVVKRRSGPL